MLKVKCRTKAKGSAAAKVDKKVSQSNNVILNFQQFNFQH